MRESFRPDIVLRAAADGDMAFIYSSWLKAHYDIGSNVKAIDRRTFESHHRTIIEKLLGRSQILIASDPEVSDLIYGWIVFEPIGAQVCIHYSYVRGSQRRFGIGRRLYEAAKALGRHDDDLPVLTSHYSPNWNWIDRRSTYNPYASDESHHPMIVGLAILKLGASSAHAASVS